MKLKPLIILVILVIMLHFSGKAEGQQTSIFPLRNVFAPLPTSLPLGTAYWEKIFDWDFNLDGNYVAFYLYVDPANNNFYQIVHYRIIPEKVRKSGVKEWNFSALQEKLQWFDPHTKKLHRFRLSYKRHWKKLWLDRFTEWEELDLHSLIFQHETAVIGKIFQIHLNHVKKQEKKNSPQ